MRADHAAFFFCGGVALGIVGLSFVLLSPSALVFVGALLMAGAVFAARKDMALCLLAFAAGLVLGTVRGNSVFAHWATLPLPEEAYAGDVRVAAYPENKKWNREIIFEPVTCTPESGCVSERILWRTSFFEAARFGERFAFSCELAYPQNFDPGFDYRGFLSARGIGYVCEAGVRGETRAPTPVQSMLILLGRARERLDASLSAVLPEPEAGLGKGLLLGGSGFLAPETEEQFKRIGMTHVVAVSGYNIMLVAEAALFLALAFWLWREQALVVALGAVCLFVFFVGAPSSALRAGVMAAFGFAALHTGRLQAPLRILSFAAALMLLWNPLLLRHDVGFQLSVLAVLGIAFSLDAYRTPTASGSASKAFGEALRATVWAQVFVWPILAYHFGQFSWFSLVANLLLLPLVPFAMVGTAVAAVSGALWPESAILFSWLAYLPLRIFTEASARFAAYGWVTLPVPEFSAWLLLPCYAGLISIGLRSLAARKQRWYAQAFTVAPRSRASRPRRMGRPVRSLDGVPARPDGSRLS